MATLEQIEAALRAADAAGNAEDAKRLAQAYAQARGQQAAPAANNSAFAQMIRGKPDPAQHGDYPSVLGPEFEKRAGGGVLGRIGYSASQVAPSLFKGDAGVRNRALEAVPGSRLERTEDGAEIVVTPEGERFYVNKPGLDVDDAFRFAGNVASYLPAGRLVRGASWGTRALQAAAGAAGTDAAGQAASGQGIDPTQVGVSALLGSGGQIAADGLVASGKAAAKHVASLRPLYESAKQMGIKLTPAQLSDSEMVKRAAVQLGKLPLAGGRSVVQAQQAAGNRTIAKMLGQQADEVTPDVLADAAHEIGKKFDSVFSGGMRYDVQFLRELGALRQEAAALDGPAQNALDALIKRVRAQSQNGAITGRTLQSLDQQARKWASGGGDRQHVAQAFRESLHETFGRQAPKAVKQTWDAARKQWATLKTIEPVVSRNPEGGIPLAQLQGAINTSKAGRTMRARGKDGDLGLLATIGQRTKAPNSSGTAENLMARNWLESLATLPLGLSARATINNSGLSPLLMRQGAGQTRQLVAPGLRPMLSAGAAYFPYPVTATEEDLP